MEYTGNDCPIKETNIKPTDVYRLYNKYCRNCIHKMFPSKDGCSLPAPVQADIEPDAQNECPSCRTTMNFTGSMPMIKHGMCNFWKCPGCGKIAIFNKEGKIIEKEG